MEKVILFGATGMVGQGVLRECLLDPRVKWVQAVGRTAVAEKNEKIHDLVLPDLWDYSGSQAYLAGFDACFFCLGTSSAGKSEAEYRRVTYDLTLAAAKALVRLNPNMTFIYVSGEGADETGRSHAMWARVRGDTENALRGLPFKAVYIMRPGMIQPLHGIQSKTALYRVLYRVLGPVMPLLRKAFPQVITTTEQVGRTMLAVAAHGADKTILKNSDFNRIAPHRI